MISRYNAMTGTFVRLRPIAVLSFTADCPMSAEVVNHIGFNGNLYRGKCLVGGTLAQKTSDEGYSALFFTQTPHSYMSYQQGAIDQMVATACGKRREQLTRDSAVKLYLNFEKQTALKGLGQQNHNDMAAVRSHIIDHFLQYYLASLSLEGFDPVRDTPVEILHTFLLGVVKYLWHETQSQIKCDNKQAFIESFNRSSKRGAFS